MREGTTITREKPPPPLVLQGNRCSPPSFGSRRPMMRPLSCLRPADDGPPSVPQHTSLKASDTPNSPCPNQRQQQSLPRPTASAVPATTNGINTPCYDQRHQQSLPRPTASTVPSTTNGINSPCHDQRHQQSHDADAHAGPNRECRTTDAGCKWPDLGLHMPAANDLSKECRCRLHNGLSRGCRCRLQIAYDGAADVGCKWPEPRVQMPAANRLSGGCRYRLQMA